MSPHPPKTRRPKAVQLYPDEPLDAALRMLSSESEIEVISRLQPDEVLGTLTLTDVYRAYGLNVQDAAEANSGH